MKRIKILLLFISFLYCSSIRAEEMVITLNYINNNENWVEDERSITIAPTATIDGNTIRIYSNRRVENASIVIKDKYNNIVYSNANIAVSQCHTFKVYDLPEGDYVLVFEIGDDSFYGYFSYQNNI